MPGYPRQPHESLQTFAAFKGLLAVHELLYRRSKEQVEGVSVDAGRPVETLDVRTLRALRDLVGPWPQHRRDTRHDDIEELLCRPSPEGPGLTPELAETVLAAAQVLPFARPMRPGGKHHPVFGRLEPGAGYPVPLHAAVHRAADLWRNNYVQNMTAERNFSFLSQGRDPVPKFGRSGDLWLNDIVRLEANLRSIAINRAAGLSGHIGQADPVMLRDSVVSVSRLVDLPRDDLVGQSSRRKLEELRTDRGERFLGPQGVRTVLLIGRALKARGLGFDSSQHHPIVGNVEDPTAYLSEDDRLLAISAAEAWDRSYLAPQQEKLHRILKVRGLEDVTASLRPQLTVLRGGRSEPSIGF